MKDSKESCPTDAGKVMPQEDSVQSASSAESKAPADEQAGLQKRDAYIQSILRAIPSGIGVVSNRIITEANLRLCEIFGYTRDELLNQSSRMLYLSDEEYAYVGAEKYRQIAEFGSGTVEVRMRRKDGIIINTLLSSTAIDPDDLSQGVTFTVLDITSLKQAEAMLRESEEKYRSLIEQSIQGMIIAQDNPPRVCFASKSMEVIIGYSPAEITGFSSQELLALVHPDDRQNYRDAFHDCMNSHLQQIRREFRMVHKNGHIRWVELFGTTIIYDGGPAIQTVMVDISERKHAEEELLNSGEKLSKLFDNIRDGLFVHPVLEDGVPGTFEMVNRSASDILGFPEQELLDMKPQDIYVPVFPDTGIDREIAMLSEPGSQIFEAVLRHKNGTKVPVEVSTGRIEISGRASIISTVRDITTRKRSYEEMKKITTALQQSPAVVVITNAHAEIEYVNPRFSELTGFAAEEVSGKNPKVLQSGLMSRETYRQLWDTLRAGKVWRGEFFNKKKNGELYWENAIIAPVKNELGEIINFVAVKEDITERKRLWNELVAAKEKAEESDRLKTCFLENMSHEIRTPMNGILGFSELLKEPFLDGSKKDEYIELIHQSGKRMLSIINDLIDISKIEAGEIAIQYTEASLDKIFHDLQAFFEPQATRKGLLLHCTGCVPPSASVIVTDKSRLIQILTNLVQNALKYTASGEISFGCTKNGDYLDFYVKDTGIGIPELLTEKIFDRFRQAQVDPVREYEGVGLGLSISKSLVELLGGRIRVQSSAGVGSVFSFTLPYCRAVSPPQEKKQAINPDNHKFNKNLCILVAEDDNVNRILLEKVLSGRGIDVVSVIDGVKAVQAVHDHPNINLVLMDIKMPNMSGYEALKEIRQFRPDLPIIAHTAFAYPEDKKYALESGFNEFLAKPFRMDDLFNLIHLFSEHQP